MRDRNERCPSPVILGQKLICFWLGNGRAGTASEDNDTCTDDPDTDEDECVKTEGDEESDGDDTDEAEDEGSDQ